MENKIVFKNAYFIKLGEGGSQEKNCIENNIITLGYLDVDHQLCLEKKWETLKDNFPYGANSGAKTRHINQVKLFYEEPKTTLWITFAYDRMWWCFADDEIHLNKKDNSKYRKVIGKWSDSNTNGDLLIKSKISGKILAKQGFRGTICSIDENEYLHHKINGTTEEHVAKAKNAIYNLETLIKPIIKNLHEKDFEIFVDLIFRQGGWSRTGIAGGTVKDIDMDLISPITQERIAIQVKSKSSLETYNSYKDKFNNMKCFKRFYFVTHSPDNNLLSNSAVIDDKRFIFWDCDELSRQAIRAGLTDWLIDKAS